MPSQSQHHGNGMLSSSHGIAGGCVDHHYTLPGSRLHINIVQANTGPGNNLKFLASLDDLGSGFSFTAHYQGFIITNYALKFLWLKAELDVDVSLSL